MCHSHSGPALFSQWPLSSALLDAGPSVHTMPPHHMGLSAALTASANAPSNESMPAFHGLDEEDGQPQHEQRAGPSIIITPSDDGQQAGGGTRPPGSARRFSRSGGLVARSPGGRRLSRQHSLQPQGKITESWPYEKRTQRMETQCEQSGWMQGSTCAHHASSALCMPCLLTCVL